MDSSVAVLLSYFFLSFFRSSFFGFLSFLFLSTTPLQRPHDDMWMPLWICLQEKAHVAGKILAEKRAISARRLFFVDVGSVN